VLRYAQQGNAAFSMFNGAEPGAESPWLCEGCEPGLSRTTSHAVAAPARAGARRQPSNPRFDDAQAEPDFRTIALRKAMNRVRHFRLSSLSSIALLMLAAACDLAAAVVARAVPPPINHEQSLSTAPRYEQYAVTDPKTVARARVIVLSYLRAGRNRPVIFAFNGGPGASSLWLNYGMLGPTRITLPQPGESAVGKFVPVPDRASPLDLADVVLIDPVDTGLSRVIEGDPKAFFSTATDGAAVAEVIRAWLKRNGRMGSPVYILGESFGCQRAATVAHDLVSVGPTSGSGAVDLRGVILVSQELNSPEVDERQGTRNIISYVVGLTDIARAARYHHLLDDQGRLVTGTDEEVTAFASTTYLEALFRGRDLANERARRIASRLNSFTGIPQAWFLQHGLAITRGEFALEALKIRGERLSIYDDRIVGPENGGDPFEKLVDRRFVEAALTDLRRVSPGESLSDYRADSDAVSHDFHYGFHGSATGERPFVGYLKELLAKRRESKVLIVGGLFDLHTTKEITRYMLSQENFGSGRVITAFYPAGHMVYTSDAGRIAFSGILHRFIEGGEHGEVRYQQRSH
jgi:carboxypeptidase C (cathepsin A)